MHTMAEGMEEEEEEEEVGCSVAWRSSGCPLPCLHNPAAWRSCGGGTKEKPHASGGVIIIKKKASGSSTFHRSCSSFAGPASPSFLLSSVYTRAFPSKPLNSPSPAASLFRSPQLFVNVRTELSFPE